MTTATISTPRMTDALERALLRSALDNQQEFSLTAAFKRIVAALKSFAAFVNEVTASRWTRLAAAAHFTPVRSGNSHATSIGVVTSR